MIHAQIRHTEWTESGESDTAADNLLFHKRLLTKLAGADDYQRYDHYDAIDVPFTDAIPSDYKGAMGVPISFLAKYNPDQFELLDANMLRREGVRQKPHGLIKDQDSAIDGKPTYVRIVIRHKDAR